MDYVSTDHAGAVNAIICERLNAHPRWQPVFLDVPEDSIPAVVVALRREGFVRACREQDTFYDLIGLPDDYEARLAMLRNRLSPVAEKPLIVVSASLRNTGALIAWARESGRRWGENLLYNDFDNDFEAHVWGVRITSLLQDYARMRAAAVEGLVDRIRGKTDRVQLLLDALRRDGDT